LGSEAIRKLLDAVDDWIPVPERPLDKPFMFPVESSCTIPGRGTVVTGNIERGTLKKGDEVEFVGYNSKVKSVVTGQFLFCSYTCVRSEDELLCTFILLYCSSRCLRLTLGANRLKFH